MKQIFDLFLSLLAFSFMGTICLFVWIWACCKDEIWNSLDWENDNE